MMGIKCHSSAREKKAILKKKVLNLDLNRSLIVHISGGSLFQSLSMATEKAQSPCCFCTLTSALPTKVVWMTLKPFLLAFFALLA